MSHLAFQFQNLPSYLASPYYFMGPLPVRAAGAAISVLTSLTKIADPAELLYAS
jgi:hypothetical protein